MSYKNQFQSTLREPEDLGDLYHQMRQMALALQREFAAIQNSGSSSTSGRSVTSLSGGGGGSHTSSDIYRASTATITVAGSNVISFSSAISGTYTIVQCILITSGNELVDLITKTSSESASSFTVNTGSDTGTLRYAILIVS